MSFTRKLVQQLLADLEDDINRDNLKRLLHYSRRMAGFQSRARYVKRAVEEVLDNGQLCFVCDPRLLLSDGPCRRTES